MHRSVGVVVPAYRPDVERLATYVAAIDERCAPTTIRIELDAPRSGMAERLADLPATVATSSYRRGKGRAIVIAPVEGGGVDLAVGSRRPPDATISRHRTFARRRLGDTFAWLARRLLSPQLFDYQCGAKAISREAWAAIREHLYEPGFAWDIELVAVADAFGLSIEEVPITWHDQPDSTVSPIETSIALAQGLLAARHRAALIAESRLHGAIAARREAPTALVDAGRPDR
ncbi:dolichol-P-glucose transferase [Halobacteriales archaeon QH_9_66_26]|nr:MAG: dolichol-P-glucose transferase [Halobacteriales archaeon QH_9_66_26]